MINFGKRGLQHLKRYCREFENIENFKEAIESSEKWVIHHKKEDEGYSKKELIELGLYYNRPAEELVFMSDSEHKRHHGLNPTSLQLIKRSTKGREYIFVCPILLAYKNKELKSMTELSKYFGCDFRILKKRAEKHGFKLIRNTKPFIGKRHTEEYKKKMSDMMKNHTVSEKTKNKLRERGKAVGQYSLDGTLLHIYKNGTDAERQTGYFSSNILACCHNRYKQAYGFIWRFINNTSF